jgi:hypothetical protein
MNPIHVRDDEGRDLLLLGFTATEAVVAFGRFGRLMTVPIDSLTLRDSTDIRDEQAWGRSVSALRSRPVRASVGPIVDAIYAARPPRVQPSKPDPDRPRS